MAAAPPPPSYDDANKDQYPPYTQAGYQTGPPPANQGYSYNTSNYPPPQQPYGQPQYQDYTGNADQEAYNAFNTNSFSDKVIRNRFIKKVYLILMCQLLFTSALVAVFVLVASVRTWVHNNLWFYILAYITFFVTYIVLACCPGVRRKFPGNYIALLVFTLMFSYVCAAIASFHDAQAVLIAAGITALVTFCISLFAIQTKIDFTMCSGLIFAASMVLFFMGIAFLIVFSTNLSEKNRYYLQCVYGGIAALIMCLFLVYDTQRIVGGKNRKNPVSAEEHILGAMELYLDIVYIFLLILSIFGGGNRD